METRVDKVAEKHKSGYNCAQAVACAYCDLVGIDEETMFRMTEGLGLGMGGMEGTCGAVSGAVFLAGLKNSCGDLEKPVSKGKTYQFSRAITAKFREKNGSLVCRDLKGIETDTPLRSCEGCILDAAALVEELLLDQENK